MPWRFCTISSSVFAKVDEYSLAFSSGGGGAVPASIFGLPRDVSLNGGAFLYQ